MSKYNVLREKLTADGLIDAEEVKLLRRVLFADGIIDREEADLLFDLNDATSGAKNDPSWQALFVEALTAHLLEDKTSPGEIDNAEADWLIARIVKDGVFDDNEKALIQNLKMEAKKISPRLLGKII
jgi:hypothetical protein